MILKQPVKSSFFRMPGPVWRRRFGDQAAGGILGHKAGLGDAATGRDRPADAGHDVLTSRAAVLEPPT